MKKLTKKEAYAAHGIIYNPAKQTIETPIGPMRELLKFSNKKIGRVHSWTLPAGLPGQGGTCACDCESCYAKTGFMAMPQQRELYAKNKKLVEEYPDFFAAALNAQLDHIGQRDGETVRIHVAGDFNTSNSAEYAAIWCNAIKAHENIRFWTYTKMCKYESLFDELPNANIVRSLINGRYNFGKADYIIDMYNRLQAAGEPVHICRCGIDPNQHCDTCTACSRYKYVLFLLHGDKTYNAEKDPRRAELVELINSQKIDA